LSLTLAFFDSAISLDRLMRGDTRRIVMFTESDVSEASL
jgi:hypothetical protein